MQVGMSDNYGGTEAIVYGIYEHLDHSQIQFDFLNVYGHPIAKQAELEAQGAHVYDLLLKRREGYFKYIHGIKAFYKAHASEFDAVVCNIQCMDQIDMAKWAKKYGIKKRIVYLHNSGYGIQPSRLARIAIGWNKRFSHRYVTTYAAGSQLSADWGYSKKDAQKTIVIKHGIDTELFAFSSAKREEFRKAHGLKDMDIVYGSAGRLDPQKNQVFLLKIYQAIHEKNPKARFLLAGRGPEEAKIRKAIKDLGLGEVCQLITNFIDFSAFYSALDIFLLPSLFEGLGLVLVEAQCSGLPCFASADTIPSSAAVLPSFTFLPLPSGPVAWSEEILKASPNPNRSSAPEAVRNAGFSLLKTAEAYLGLFK